MENKALWEKFYKDGKYIMWEPSEATIKFFGRISKDMDIKGMKALDFGCGVGRNTLYMASIGLDLAIGIDISEEAINLARDHRPKNNNALFSKYMGETLPFEDNYFDFVISHGVLDHMIFNKAKEIMKEIHRVLKHNGWLELELHSVFDSGFGKGKEIENNIFIIENECEKGLPQHYFDMEELLILLKDFEIKKVFLNDELTLDNIKFTVNHKSSFWVLYLQKKGDND